MSHHVILFWQIDTQANTDLRAALSVEAKRVNMLHRGERRVENHARPNAGSSPPTTLLGLGNKEYPLTPEILKDFSTPANGKSGVKWHSAKWSEEHGATCGGFDFPEVAARKVCSDVCVSEINEVCRAVPQIHQKVKSLLLDVCRSVKAQTFATRKQLSMSARHPILLAKCGDNLQAWIITHPVFKPLQFDCIELSPMDVNQGHYRMLTDKIGGIDVLAFRSMKKVTGTLCALASRAPGSELNYSISWSYNMRLTEQLADLFLPQLPVWIALSEVADDHSGSDHENDDDNENGEDGNDVPDLSEIDEMVSLLNPSAKTGNQNLRRSKKTKSSSDKPGCMFEH